MKYKLKMPVHTSIGTKKYSCLIEWRNGKFIADEPEDKGGADAGPDPFTLLLSSLASCTLITLRMYIDYKKMDIPSIVINVNMYEEIIEGIAITVIDKDISFSGHVDEAVKTKLLEVANRCPISKIFEGNVKIRSFIFREDEHTKTINYANKEISVEWKPELCQHSTRCWKQLNSVFDPRIKKWINVDGASAERIKEQVAKCPSGALVFHYNNQQESMVKN